MPFLERLGVRPFGGFGDEIDEKLVAGRGKHAMLVILHQLGNSHGMCFDLLFISFDFCAAIGDLALQRCNLSELFLKLRRELDGGKPRRLAP